MWFLRVFEFPPKIAWTPPLTSITPAAPKAFKRSLSTLEVSPTSTRKRVIHASKFSIFSAPPNASNTNGAFSFHSSVPAVAVVASADPPLRSWKSFLENNFTSSLSS